MPVTVALAEDCRLHTLADPEIPDAPASGRDCPDPGQTGIPHFPNPEIPAKSGFPISRIPKSRPNRDSPFPESRDPGQIGIQIRENPDFFCSGKNRDFRHLGENTEYAVSTAEIFLLLIVAFGFRCHVWPHGRPVFESICMQTCVQAPFAVSEPRSLRTAP